MDAAPDHVQYDSLGICQSSHFTGVARQTKEQGMRDSLQLRLNVLAGGKVA
jgi:hypothetical protein